MSVRTHHHQHTKLLLSSGKATHIGTYNLVLSLLFYLFIHFRAGVGVWNLQVEETALRKQFFMFFVALEEMGRRVK